MSFTWPEHSPSPSPPPILSYYKNELVHSYDEQSPSPPWGRSPSPPALYLKFAEYRKHNHYKKTTSSRWDQRREKAASDQSRPHKQKDRRAKTHSIVLVDTFNLETGEADVELCEGSSESLSKLELELELELNQNYDSRIGMKSASRTRRKRAFAWIEQNSFVKQAQLLRAKEMRDFQQRSKIRASVDIRETVMFNFNFNTRTNGLLIGDIENVPPMMEWWDMNLLASTEQDQDMKQPDEAKLEMTKMKMKMEMKMEMINQEMITSLIEHPKILRAALLKDCNDGQSVFLLTKKEQRKMRRIERKQRHEQLTDRIRLGLADAPEPRLKISNIMRVLGSNAICDPSSMELKARAQMLKRKMKHELQNETRKLSAEQRREKKRIKLIEDSTSGVLVNVFCVPYLRYRRKAKFKICKNAEQLNLTGVCLSVPAAPTPAPTPTTTAKKSQATHKASASAIIVEGGPKGIAKYERLILHRIQWQQTTIHDTGGDVQKDGSDSGSGSNSAGVTAAVIPIPIPTPTPTVNTDLHGVQKPQLIWSGVHAKRSFTKFFVKEFESETERESFCAMHNIQSYFDYIASASQKLLL